MQRRSFVSALMTGTVISALGGAAYVLADDEDERKARTALRPDGRPRLPPNQYLLKRLRPMGGDEGDPSPSGWRLQVHGEVESPFTLDFAALLAMPQVEQTCDVHCVTKWTVLGAAFSGVPVSDLAARANVKPSPHQVIFEAAHGSTPNVPPPKALAPTVLVAHRYGGTPLRRPHAAPARALIPDLYFWKSAKWLTGLPFAAEDRPS